MANSPAAERLLADIRNQVQASGWLESYFADVKFDQPGRIRVELRFGVITRFGPPKHKPLGNQAPIVIIDQTLIVEKITGYQYDFIDHGYGFRQAFHLHSESGIPAQSHWHFDAGAKKKRSLGKIVSVDYALGQFFKSYVANRWG